jgi:hypothetical protein
VNKNHYSSSSPSKDRRPPAPGTYIGCYRSLLNASVFNLTPGSCYGAHQASAVTTRALRGCLRTSPFSDSRAALLPRRFLSLPCSASESKSNVFVRKYEQEPGGASGAESSAGCWKRGFCSSSLCSGSGMAVCADRPRFPMASLLTLTSHTGARGKCIQFKGPARLDHAFTNLAQTMRLPFEG